jgi:hypothetical protein
MHVVLFLVGIVLAFAGAVLIYSVPVPVVDPGAAALFSSGALAMVGGLILMGLAAAVRVLNRIAERLEIQPLPLPPVASVGREDPAPRAARAQVAPAAPAPAAPRASLLGGWFGRGSAPVPATAARQTIARATPEPAAAPADLAPLAHVPEEPRAAAPAPAVASPPAPAPPPPPPTTVAPPPVAPPRPAAPRPVAPPQPAAPQPAAGTPETTVYKSGVIDGMAYTLFMDGAIEAELPQGRVKFASIDELQKYLTGK